MQYSLPRRPSPLACRLTAHRRRALETPTGKSEARVESETKGKMAPNRWLAHTFAWLVCAGTGARRRTGVGMGMVVG